MTEPTKVEPGKYSKQFPELEYVLGYFHEDMFDGFEWQGRKPSYHEVIRHIKITNSLTNIKKATGELQLFLQLSRDWNEDNLEDVLLNDFGNSIYAPGVGITYREFLEGILEILEEPIEKTESEFIPKFIG